MLGDILSIVNKFIPDKNAAKRMAVQIEKETTKQMTMKSDIIKAEQANGSGKWRVRLMYLCMTMVASHFIMYDVIPFIRTSFDLNFYVPEAPIDEHLWTFLNIGVGGYIGSRGVEKIAAHIRGR